MDLSRINKTITDLEKETKAVEERKAKWLAKRERNKEAKAEEESVAQLLEELGEVDARGGSGVGGDQGRARRRG